MTDLDKYVMLAARREHLRLALERGEPEDVLKYLTPGYLQDFIWYVVDEVRDGTRTLTIQQAEYMMSIIRIYFDFQDAEEEMARNKNYPQQVKDMLQNCPPEKLQPMLERLEKEAYYNYNGVYKQYRNFSMIKLDPKFRKQPENEKEYFGYLMDVYLDIFGQLTQLIAKGLWQTD